MLLHVHIGDLEVRVWLGVVNKITVDVLVGTFLVIRYDRDIFPSLRRITPENLRPVYISAKERNKETSLNEIVTKDVRTVAENLCKDEIRVARQTVIPPGSESSVPVVSTMAGV